MREDHDRRMINYTDEKTELVRIYLLKNVPKPRSKNNYCSVCHHSYGDYLEVLMILDSILKEMLIRKESTLRSSINTF